MHRRINQISSRRRWRMGKRSHMVWYIIPNWANHIHHHCWWTYPNSRSNCPHKPSKSSARSVTMTKTPMKKLSNRNILTPIWMPTTSMALSEVSLISRWLLPWPQKRRRFASSGRWYGRIRLTWLSCCVHFIKVSKKLKEWDRERSVLIIGRSFRKLATLLL